MYRIIYTTYETDKYNCQFKSKKFRLCKMKTSNKKERTKQ